MEETAEKYYQDVNEYYNDNARNYEMRYDANKLLQRIRESFRNESLPYVGKNMLEIGVGPGLDLIYFSRSFPEATISGIDVSEDMYMHARNNIKLHQLRNVTVRRGSIEDIGRLYPGVQFDFIYIYFGAFNTVNEVPVAVDCLRDALCPGGYLVVTFINKYYLSLSFKNLLRGRFKEAGARLGPTWGGYSPSRFLKCRCYSYREISTYFRDFRMVRRRGYSIVYPPWYDFKKFQGKQSLRRRLWKIDKWLNRTFLWQCGEYCLCVLQKPG